MLTDNAGPLIVLGGCGVVAHQADQAPALPSYVSNDRCGSTMPPTAPSRPRW
ncbi:MAG: hypothetical protein IPN17_26765 [Deltaproteobacteria bacterium]|nr:hypothetical protein [Deltaproteobacteria bacterium]